MPMKEMLLCLLLLCLVTACQQQAADTTAPPPPAATATVAATVAAEPTIAQRFSPIISGYWVSADYLKAVARTRSPLAAFDHTPPGPSSLEIRPFAGQKDSVEIGASYGLHEGGDMLLLLQHGTEAHSLPIRLKYGGEAGTTTELAYRLTSTDTTLFYITRKTKTQQILSKLAYRRTGRPGKKPDLEAGVAWGVNDLLISGNYSGLDSLHQPVRAQFLTSGLVEGLSFSKYSIQIDFTGPNPGDAIFFDLYTSKQQQLAASFGHDTLKLYTVHSASGVPAGATDTIETFTRGRLRYQLVRLKKP